MEIRIATGADFDAVMRLINAAFAIELSFKVRDRINHPELEEYFGKGNFLLSEENGRPTGCVFVERTGEHAYLGLLSVDPSLQKQGLGRRLVAASKTCVGLVVRQRPRQFPPMFTISKGVRCPKNKSP